MKLEKKDLNIKELNLSSPLYFSTLKYFRTHYKVDFDVYLPTKNLNLQRGSVWSLEQKQALIQSVFKQRLGSYNGIKIIPSLSAVQKEINKDEKIFEIIDGKQRLTTLYSFLDGEFPILIKGEEYRFNDLSDELQRIIYGFPMEIVVKYSYPDEPVTDQEKIDWFEMINFFGTPQELEHLQNIQNGK